METTTPHTSSPTMNCSPNIAKIMFSQNLDAKPLRRRIIHFPPFLLASSYPTHTHTHHYRNLTVVLHNVSVLLLGVAMGEALSKMAQNLQWRHTHLPHGFNSLFEQVEIAVTRQISRTNQVTVELPELFHLHTRAQFIHLYRMTAQEIHPTLNLNKSS